MAERSYAVGLPVSITVRDDGFVSMSVDLSEAAQEIREYDVNQFTAGDATLPTEAELDTDALLVDRWSDLNTLEHGEFAPGFPAEGATCQHCGRQIIKDAAGRWIDPEATGDDSIWRETCDRHDTFTAEHEPEEGTT